MGIVRIDRVIVAFIAYNAAAVDNIGRRRAQTTAMHADSIDPAL